MDVGVKQKDSDVPGRVRVLRRVDLKRLVILNPIR
jgi:hypothetical protein